MEEFLREERNTVKRGKKKARYDKETIFSILDAAEICFIAFSHEGKAMVQPINFGRKEDKLYIHGSTQNRMAQAIIDAGEVCLSVMILDAMKLTRSAYHHSVNFRSAVIFGKVKEMVTDEEKLKGLEALINHFVPGRWDHCRIPDHSELKATRVIEIEIESASAKVADQPASEKHEDLNLDYWAGIIPINVKYGPAVSDQNLKEGINIPDHILDFLKQ